MRLDPHDENLERLDEVTEIINGLRRKKLALVIPSSRAEEHIFYGVVQKRMLHETPFYPQALEVKKELSY